jgi:hypothetical protein
MVITTSEQGCGNVSERSEGSMRAASLLLLGKKMSDGTREKNALALCVPMIPHIRPRTATPISLLGGTRPPENTTCPLYARRSRRIETERKSVSEPVDLYKKQHWEL